MLRILLVEDNRGDARLIRELLADAGSPSFELTHVERLADASEFLAGNVVDAVLLDLSLPDAHGLETVLQARIAAPEVPIIVLTGLDDEEMALQAMRAGAQDYLVKGEITGRLVAHSVRYAIERARLEQERRSLLQSERAARALAEAAVRSRDEVLGIVAHDLRNPLAVINTTTKLLLRGAVAADQNAEQLQVVRQSTEQMDRLIQDLLDVASIEGGTLRVQPRPVPARTLLDEAAALLDAQVAQAGLALNREVEGEVPEVVADRPRILQVLTNLVGNALRFTAGGGTITLRVRPFGEAVLLSVADTGVGIPPSDLPHLFDRAWQADHARRGGTGRGLAISKGIVEAHGGRIWAASEPGCGSTFFFTLPLAPVDASAGEEHADATGDPTPLSPAEIGRPLRVVLADDHSTFRRGLEGILREVEGVEVVGQAASGEEAIQLAERLRPDVVLMDIAMPGMGGIDATRQITSSLPDVRVLALTAENEEDVLLPVLRAGGSGFVRKTSADRDLLPALATVARDEVFLYASGNRLLLGDFLREEGPESAALASLDEQERELMRLAAEGYTSTEIGKKLFLSPKTVDSYRSRLMRQLGLGHRSDLVRFALRAGLLKPE